MRSENLKHEKDIQLPVPTRRDLFGVPLEELMGWDGEKGGVPRVIRDAVQFLRETGAFSWLPFACTSAHAF
jgi:Rho GTPase-activating protein 1